MEHFSDVKELDSDLAKHVDVLIQHSESGYALSEAVAKSADQTGHKARLLARRAIGHEIVSRLYRVIKDQPDL